MSKTRTDDKNRPLPERLHFARGHYYHVRRVEGKNKWSALGADYVAALAKWARLEGAGNGAQTVSQVVESYLVEKGAKNQRLSSLFQTTTWPVRG